MEKLIGILTMCLCGGLCTGIGLYAIKRREPMWFWIEQQIRSEELRDVAAYNRVNGIMWLVYSVVVWLSAFACAWGSAALQLLAFGAIAAGSIALFPVYRYIYKKYSVKA